MYATDSADTVGMDPNINYGLYKIYQPNPHKEYVTINGHKGIIKITRFDPLKMIISGTFEFRAQLLGDVDSVNITNGRFDLRFKDSY